MTKEQKRIHLKIYGRVQGVFFRRFTKEQADVLGLTGWVQNTEDRAVEVVAEGGEEDLKKFQNKLELGSRAAKVERIEADWQAATGDFTDFQIKY